MRRSRDRQRHPRSMLSARHESLSRPGGSLAGSRASGAWGSGRRGPCGPRPTNRPRTRAGRPSPGSGGRRARAGRASAAPRPPASLGCSRHAEHVLHPDRRRRPVGGVVDRHARARRAASTRRRQRVELGARAATAAGRAAARRGRGARDRPAVAPRDRYGRSHVVEGGEQGAVREVGPRDVAEPSRRRNATRARSCVAAGVHVEHGELRRPHPVDEGVAVSSPGVGRATSSPSAQGVEPSLDAQHEIVASRSQLRRRSLDDIVEQGGDVGGVDRRAEADAGAGAPAVEIGGDDELGVRQRIVVGEPRRRAGAQLELAPDADAPPAGPGTRRAAGARCASGSTVPRSKLDAGAAGEVGGALARAGAAPAGRRVRRDVGRRRGRRAGARSAGSSSGRPRRTSRSSTSAATTHASRRWRRRRRSRARRGCSGRSTIRRPRAVSAPSSPRAPSVREQRVRLPSTPACGGGSGNARSLDRRAPRRHLERQAGQVDLRDLGGAVGRPAAVLDASTTAGKRRPARCVRRGRRAGRPSRG